ncbi:MAG: ribokinase [Bacilli bacterium]|jgi:ribokinase
MFKFMKGGPATISRSKIRRAMKGTLPEHKVIVAGSIITDMSVKVTMQPQVGETVMGNELKYSPGGKGANQAVSAARLGANVVMMGSIGQDNFGKDSYEFLREQDITCHIKSDYDNPTGIAMIQVNDKGNNSIVVIPGANMTLEPIDVDNFTYRKGDVLVSQFEIPLPTVKRFFHKGKASNCINILNPAPAIMNDQVREILDLTDVLVVNETELEVMLECKFPDGVLNMYDEALTAIRNFKKDNQVIIVTLGDKGCIGYIGNVVVKVPGVKMKVVDTTGAGDCFVGALAYVISTYKLRLEKIFPNSSVLADALYFANDAAAVSVTKQGSGVAMPNLEEIKSTIEYLKSVGEYKLEF